jgi:hypothetical protein
LVFDEEVDVAAEVEVCEMRKRREKSQSRNEK